MRQRTGRIGMGYGSTTHALDAMDPVDALLRRLADRDEDYVLVDSAGRHPDLRDGRVDLDATGVSEPAEVQQLLDTYGHAVLDAGSAPACERSSKVAQALIATQVARHSTGHPRWIVVEDAQDLLRDPDLPPEALKLEDGGYCLVRRTASGVSSTLVPRQR